MEEILKEGQVDGEGEEQVTKNVIFGDSLAFNKPFVYFPKFLKVMGPI